jgi:hypothetical protein
MDDRPCWSGKPILKLTQSGPGMEAEAAIMILTFTDGTRTRVHANDLGQWETDFPPEGAPYSSWTSIMDEYSNGGPSEDPLVEILPGILRFTRVSSGQTYDLDLTAPRVAGWPWTEKVLTHPRGLELLSEAASCGAFWRICFNKSAVTHGGVPPELLLTAEDTPNDS